MQANKELHRRFRGRRGGERERERERVSERDGVAVKELNVKLWYSTSQ